MLLPPFRHCVQVIRPRFAVARWVGRARRAVSAVQGHTPASRAAAWQEHRLQPRSGPQVLPATLWRRSYYRSHAFCLQRDREAFRPGDTHFRGRRESCAVRYRSNSDRKVLPLTRSMAELPGCGGARSPEVRVPAGAGDCVLRENGTYQLAVTETCVKSSQPNAGRRKMLGFAVNTPISGSHFSVRGAQLYAE